MKKLFLVVLSLSLWLIASVLPAFAQGTTRTSEIYVRFEQPVGSSEQSLLSSLGGAIDASLIRTAQPVAAPSGKISLSTGGEIWSLTATSLRAAETLVSQLRSLPGVRYAEQGYTYNVYSRPNDPRYSMQEYLTRIGAEEAWSRLPAGDRIITVAVIDDGVAWNHEDLAANIYSNPNEQENGNDDDDNGKVDDIRGWDFVGNTSNAEAALGLFKENNNPLNVLRSHGTQVASVIGAVSDNNIGMAGIGRRVRILPIKIGSDDPLNSNLFRLPSAIFYAMEQGADIICVSAGREAPLDEEGIFGTLLEVEREVVNEALSRNIVIVAAAGNRGGNATDRIYPASLPGVLAVAGAADDDFRSATSNFGTFAPLYAPSEEVLGAVVGNGYEPFSGTSAAAAIVAGAAALVRQAHPDLPSYGIVQQLKQSSDIVGRRTSTFFGRVNLGNAMRLNRDGEEAVGGIALASPSSPFIIEATISEENIVPRSLIGSRHEHKVSVDLLNYLADVNDVVVEVRLINPNNNYVVLGSDYAPLEIPRWRTGEENTLSFPVFPNPEMFERDEVQRFIQYIEIAIHSRSSDFVNYEVIAIEVAPDADGLEEIYVEQRVELSKQSPTGFVRVTNTGLAPVTIVSITAEGDDQIVIGSFPTLPLILSEGASLEVPVSMEADEAGEFGKFLTVAILREIPDDEIVEGEPLPDSTISNTGYIVGRLLAADLRLSREAITFPLVRANNSERASFVIVNEGEEEVSLSAAVSGGDNAAIINAFRLENMPARLGAGESAEVEVVFAPTIGGRHTIYIGIRGESNGGSVSEAFLRVEGEATGNQARLLFSADGRILQRGENLLLPAVEVGRSRTVESIALVNGGNAPLSVSNIRLSGMGDDEVTVVAPTGTVNIPAGSSIPLQLQYQPRLTGEKNIVLEMTAAGQTVRQPLIGSLVNTFLLDVINEDNARTPAEIVQDGGIRYYLVGVRDVSVGGVSDGNELPFTNRSTTPRTISSIRIEGEHASEFRLVGANFPRTIAAGEGDTLEIEFRPTGEGRRNARMTVSYAGTSAQDIVDIIANGLGQRVLSPAVFRADDDGEVAGQETEDYVQVFPTTFIGDVSEVLDSYGYLNNGSTIERIAAQIVGRDAADFTLTSGSGPFEIFPEGGINFEVSFLPLSEGIKRARLRISSQSGLQFEVSLNGRGAERPSIILGEEVVDFGEQDFLDITLLPIVVRSRNLTGDVLVSSADPGVFGFQTAPGVDELEGSTFILRRNVEDEQIDTIFIAFRPPAIGEEYEAFLRFNTSDADESIVGLRGVGRAPTRPRIFGPDVLFFDSVEVRGNPSAFTTPLDFLAFNLVEDVVIETSEHFFIFFEPDVYVTSHTVSAELFMDTSVTIAFRPTGNIVGDIPGTVTMRSGDVELEIECALAVARPRQGFTVDEELTIAPTLVGDTVFVDFPVLAAFLAPMTNIEVEVIGDENITLEYQGEYYQSTTLTINMGSSVFLQPTFRLRFIPTDEERYNATVAFRGLRIDGDDALDFSVITGTGFLPPEFTVSDQEIFFGRVTLFTAEPFFIDLEGIRLDDTLFIELQEREPTFSFAIGEVELQQEYAFPIQNRRLNSTLVVFAEPTEYGRHVDTLILRTSGFEERIPIVAIGADTTTSIHQGRDYGRTATLRAMPSVANDAIVVEVANLPATGSGDLIITDLVGNEVFRRTLHPTGSRQRFNVPVNNLATGMYLVRLAGTKSNYQKIIIKR